MSSAKIRWPAAAVAALAAAFPQAQKPAADTVIRINVNLVQVDAVVTDSRTRLFRDGQEVYTGAPRVVSGQAQDDPKRLIVAGSLKLGGKIAKGDYVLQVIVTDKPAKEKYRTAA